MNKPETGEAPVYALEAALPQPVKDTFFSGAVGRLEGNALMRVYHLYSMHLGVSTA